MKNNTTKTDILNRMGQVLRSNKLFVGTLVFMAVVTSIGFGLEYPRNAEQGGPLSGATTAPVPEAQRKVQLWEGGPYWATTNIGAEKPEDYGYYFWWGDTVGYKREGNAWVATDGSSSNFLFYEPISRQTDNKGVATLRSEGWIVTKDGVDVLAPGHDAAQVQWGGGWRMPTFPELTNLVSNCDWTWTTRNGVNGHVVRGRGDYASNSIFLPCAGCGYGDTLYGAGSYGDYWSSVPCSDFNYAYLLSFDSDRLDMSLSSRDYGQPVRAVKTSVTITFDANGGTVSPTSQSYAANGVYGSLPTPSYTDHPFLGWFTAANGGTQVTAASTIPASAMTLYAHWKERGKVQLWEGGPYWATENIGAEKPEEYGYYFWWGDTVGYRCENDAWVATDGSSSNFSFGYSRSNTPTYNKSIATLQSEGWVVSQEGTYVLAPEHDAAQVQWGGGWRMPTYPELTNLVSNCDWTWTTRNGVKGYVVRGRGDYASNSIFLPCAGCGHEDGLGGAGSYGYYWSSVPDLDNNRHTRHLSFDSYDRSMDDYFVSEGPFDGASVRPVQGGTKESGAPYETNIGAPRNPVR